MESARTLRKLPEVKLQRFIAMDRSGAKQVTVVSRSRLKSPVSVRTP